MTDKTHGNSESFGSGTQHSKSQYSKRPNLIMLAVGGIILPSLIVFGGLHLGRVSSEDVENYRRLVDDASTNKSEVKNEPYQAKQKRLKVQKEILFTQGAGRLQVKLMAADSQMVLDHHDEKTEVIEHMNDVDCYMQEELYFLLPDGREAIEQMDGRLLVRKANPEDPSAWFTKETPGLKPMQIVRHMVAGTASYYYKTDLFMADDVTISRFIVPGHDLNKRWNEKKPIMKGVAESVEFSLNGKDLNFKASKMRATLYAPEKSI